MTSLLPPTTMFCFNEYSFSRFFLNLYSRRKTTLAWKDELDQIPPADWKLAARRERIIAPLADHDHVTQSEIEQAGEALRLGPAMVFRLLARYRRKRCTSVLVLEPLGRKCGSRILDPSLEKIIQTAIDGDQGLLLSARKPSLASLHREVRQACHQAGTTPSSYKAIQSRVRDFDPREAITRRLGPKQAAQLLSPVKEGLHVKEPLQLLQMKQRRTINQCQSRQTVNQPLQTTKLAAVFGTIPLDGPFAQGQ